jgi:hypothetical protein
VGCGRARESKSLVDQRKGTKESRVKFYHEKKKKTKQTLLHSADERFGFHE